MRRLGPRGCGACSHAGSALSNSALPPTRPSTFCATETGARTGRRSWWAGLRGVASAASCKDTHVGAHALLAEAIAAVPQLQLRLTRAMGRTAKQQTWAAELTTGEHLNVLAELLPTVVISCLGQGQRLLADEVIELPRSRGRLVLMRHGGRGALVSRDAGFRSCHQARRLQQALGLPRLDWVVLLDPVPAADQNCWQQLSQHVQVLPRGELSSPGLLFRSAPHGSGEAHLQLGHRCYCLRPQGVSANMGAVAACGGCHTTKPGPPKTASSAAAHFSGAKSGRPCGGRCAIARSGAGVRASAVAPRP